MIVCYECRTSYQAQPQAPAAMRRPHTTTPKHFDNLAELRVHLSGGRGDTTVQSGECSGARSYSTPLSVC